MKYNIGDEFEYRFNNSTPIANAKMKVTSSWGDIAEVSWIDGTGIMANLDMYTYLVDKDGNSIASKNGAEYSPFSLVLDRPKFRVCYIDGSMDYEWYDTIENHDHAEEESIVIIKKGETLTSMTLKEARQIYT